MKIKINDTNLFYDVYGSKLSILEDSVIEKPTMIVLHGGHGFADHTLYVEFWSQFSTIAQVVFLDQRGCGRSDRAQPDEWNLAHWAEDLFQFCKALGIEKPIIAGVSMGGHVMCEYVKRYPEHPGGLIFCNTEARFVLQDMCDILRVRAGDEAAELCYKQFTAPNAEITQKYMEVCVPYYAHNAYSKTELGRCIKHLDVFDHYCKNEINTFDYLNDMKKINCPTLLLVGEDSPFHPPVRAVEMAKEIPEKHVDLQIVKHAGAAVYKDQPEESYQIVKDFLTQFGE